MCVYVWVCVYVCVCVCFIETYKAKDTSAGDAEFELDEVSVHD